MGTVTLAEIQGGAAPSIYPRAVLEGCETALVLFAAAFHGQQDAVWMAGAGLTATCVDVDAEKLGEMEQVYPADWEYAYGDVVSLDPPSNLFGRCAKLLPTWCGLARHAVILGTGEATVIVEPEDWRVSECVRRSNFQGGCYWTVLTPC
jgi:hypothetical protein